MGPTRIGIQLTEIAARAIVNQADYYASQQDETLASRWDKAVSRAIDSLLKMPERGSLCYFQPGKLKMLRRISVPGFPQHLVFYQYMLEERAVRIVHVLHGARDIEAILSRQPGP
jgi:plasmid stabilization system protein ParE